MKKSDRLYESLPVVYRQRDADYGYPLRALLQVIAEQVEVVEDDIAQLNENWFIETCEDWVVPYIGDLIGYRQVHEAGEPGDPRHPQARALNKILIPRREVANTIGYRRRKGTLALLELLADNAAGWPARVAEFYKLLGWTQHLNHQRPHRGRTVDLSDGNVLDLLGGPFDKLAHTVEVRRVNSQRTQGLYNIPTVGVFVWRLRPYSVTKSPAFCVDEHPNCYTFSVLGNDAPLYNQPQPETDPTHVAGELNLPTLIRLRPFEHTADYYGEGQSLQISIGQPNQQNPIPLNRIVSADLSGWHYQPQAGQIAVDPVRGRLAFAESEAPRDQIVWVSYHYAFSADIGGGEYDRSLSQPRQFTRYRVGEKETLKTINAALNRWQQDLAGPDSTNDPKLQNAVIEITDSGLYEENVSIKLGKGQTLQLRAANRKRPVLSLPETRAKLDALFISGDQGSRVTLDGLLIVGRGVKISGPNQGSRPRDAVPSTEGRADLCDVTIRHCTLVPGWSLDCDCEPRREEEPSLVLSNTTAEIKIKHSILGSIEVEANEAATDPVRLCVSDSILDATNDELPALNGVESQMACVRLTVARCTVFGEVMTHEIALAENCIFMGRICVARRQTGCVRFCYVSPDSRTPRRYECQPDLVLKAVQEKFARGDISSSERDAEMASEQLRVEPKFNSTRYGTPTYCQLADSCAEEIKRGADDESEMGAFHDLFQPQRAGNLRARLDEYTPAGMEAGIIYAT